MTFELLWLSRPRRGTVWSRGIKSCKQKSGSIAMQSADQPPQPDPGQLLGKPWLACLLTSFKLSSTGPDPGAHSWRRSLAAGAAADRSSDLTFFQQHSQASDYCDGANLSSRRSDAKNSDSKWVPPADSGPFDSCQLARWYSTFLLFSPSYATTADAKALFCRR
jgi:hypothetical protein